MRSTPTMINPQHLQGRLREAKPSQTQLWPRSYEEAWDFRKMCRKLWLPSTAFHCLLWYLFSEKRSVWLAGSKFIMQFRVAFIVRHCCTINMLTWCYIALSENRPPKSDVWSITWVYRIPHVLRQQHSFGTPFWLRPIHCRPRPTAPIRFFSRHWESAWAANPASQSLDI